MTDFELQCARNAERRARSLSVVEMAGVRARIKEAAAAIGTHVAVVMERHITDVAPANYFFESPIELIFFGWWSAIECAATFDPQYTDGPYLRLSSQEDVVVEGQTFRVDFRVQISHPSEFIQRYAEWYPLIAIELDGHDFHERTKEQVIYRNQRDRALQAARWRVFHVSGSELARDPIATVSGIHAICSEEYDRVRKEHSPFRKPSELNA